MAMRGLASAIISFGLVVHPNYSTRKDFRTFVREANWRELRVRRSCAALSAVADGFRVWLWAVNVEAQSRSSSSLLNWMKR
jgi:hypothetical protein